MAQGGPKRARVGSGRASFSHFSIISTRENRFVLASLVFVLLVVGGFAQQATGFVLHPYLTLFFAILLVLNTLGNPRK